MRILPIPTFLPFEWVTARHETNCNKLNKAKVSINCKKDYSRCLTLRSCLLSIEISFGLRCIPLLWCLYIPSFSCWEMCASFGMRSQPETEGENLYLLLEFLSFPHLAWRRPLQNTGTVERGASGIRQLCGFKFQDVPGKSSNKETVYIC